MLVPLVVDQAQCESHLPVVGIAFQDLPELTDGFFVFSIPQKQFAQLDPCRGPSRVLGDHRDVNLHGLVIFPLQFVEERQIGEGVLEAGPDLQ